MRALCLVLLLSGCATQPNLYQSSQNQCRSMGFIDGTDNFLICVQNEFNARRQMALRMLGY